MDTLFKSFGRELKGDNIQWKIGEWYHQEGIIQVYENGFHASHRAVDAMKYRDCEILAMVEVKGKKSEKESNSAHEYMRIKRAYYWNKRDSVALARYLKFDIPNEKSDLVSKLITAALGSSPINSAFFTMYAVHTLGHHHPDALEKCESFIKNRIALLDRVNNAIK